MNNFDWVSDALPYVLVFLAALPGIYAIRKNKAEVRKIEADVAKQYKDMLTEEIVARKEERDELEKRISHLEEGVRILIKQMEGEGICPDWRPNGN